MLLTLLFLVCGSFPLRSSSMPGCELDFLQKSMLQNAIQYYKSERYLETEIELSRILTGADCKDVRLFRIFSLIRQGREIGSSLTEKDFDDIRIRILYDFSNLVQTHKDYKEPKRNSNCFYPDCRLEKLEMTLIYFITLTDFASKNESSGISAQEGEEKERLVRFREEEGKKVEENSKNPYGSAFLSALLPGAGQVYSDQFAEGVTSFFVNLVLISASYALYVAEPTGVLFYTVSGISVITYITNIIGAYAAANRNNNYWKEEAIQTIKKEFIGLGILEKEILFRLYPREFESEKK
ncbi:hypothetical protein LEP1GSC061_1755 [Leptospira wolffii serovar Khorat str. Khorat-H2]|nr:hypothetical protein LEP1GSC061_1755 [Leptospira wolffii serovar Khorat str. Khorat-H2]